MVAFERVLVTGASGQLGRYVVDELRDRCAVTTLDLAPAAFDLPHVRADVLDPVALGAAVAGHDAVVHVAALDSAIKAPDEDFFQVNVVGTWTVLHAARAAGVRKTIVTSSSMVTGFTHDNLANPPEYLPVDEAHPLRPTQTYGLTKQLCEAAAESFARRGPMEVAVIRPAYVLFPHLVSRLAARAREPERRHFPWLERGATVGPLTLFRTYVTPEDTARCYRMNLERSGTPYDVFFCSAADSIEPRPILEFYADLYGILPEVRKPEVFECDPHASPIDCTHAREVLGWAPTSSWTELMRVAAAPGGAWPDERARPSYGVRKTIVHTSPGWIER